MVVRIWYLEADQFFVWGSERGTYSPLGFRLLSKETVLHLKPVVLRTYIYVWGWETRPMVDDVVIVLHGFVVQIVTKFPSLTVQVALQV